MVIILVQPRMAMRPMDTGMKARMAPSLALLTIANIIGEGHRVVIRDENVEEIDYDEPADLAGITVTVDVLGRACRIAEEFRKRGVPTVAGGIHITAYPESAAGCFDALCIGMAERTWPDIVRDCEARALKKIYRCGSGIKGSDIVPPAYHMADRSKYLYCNIISTSRGCPFRCDFCYNSCEAYRDLYINRPVADVIQDIKSIGKRHIMFIDDNLIGNPAWTMELVRELKKLNVKWNAAVSANIVDMPELLDEMKASGCRSLFIGFESLNGQAISGVHKSQNQVRKYERLATELHKRGIMINASFVFGLDGDDKDTFRATLDWIVRNKIETVTSHILTPYPGTRVYEDFLEAGRITDFDFSRYNTANVVFRPENMTAGELYDGYIGIYKEIYSLTNILRRMPAKQKIPYLLFNLFYRKYGRMTDRICRLITYERIGRIAERLSYGPLRARRN